MSQYIDPRPEIVKVWTRDSFYTFDMGAGTVTRTPGPDAAKHPVLSDTPLKLAALHVCAVGEYMHLTVDCPFGNNYPIKTSEVRRIEITRDIGGYSR